jgi:glycine cleavage system H lipoate-binding protein
MSPSDKTWHIVPPDEMRCIWMTAGIISYQLCDRGFECDDCPLDAALRSHQQRKIPLQEQSREEETRALRLEGLQSDIFYSRNHCWLKTLRENLVRVGVEPGLSAALLAPRAVVFPSAGQRLLRGQTGVWIVMEGGTLPLESPVDGIVRRTNHQLSSHPHLLASRPNDAGWVLELEWDPSSLEQAGLMDRDQADSVYGRDQDRFLASLQNAAAGGHSPAGVTLADGGQRLQNVADLIGPYRYFALLRKIFC